MELLAEMERQACSVGETCHCRPEGEYAVTYCLSLLGTSLIHVPDKKQTMTNGRLHFTHSASSQQ